ncbi:glycosyltransferase family 2 protein [Steroidobacter sp. S1-65]|uniref:Glycosyltransferase family 2 protein n=1 Tax=Steroidobacter gossypii TaxID=2805490 RepID=A0ABS1X6Q1_9GAMM|nr:glycosyltransferase family 2 protein [Steroidobacter gossypii]MBM0108907.1 glycosyltransferase family 2 protein [Steroidobacter gossypii]
MKLSICIASYNRAAFIGATIESIVSQITEECEIVVSDNASTDSTEEVVQKFAVACTSLRYVRQTENRGLDKNFDCAVELARGEYCWLMADDDLLKPGAVATVLGAIKRDDYSLIAVNYERKDFNMSRVLVAKYLDAEVDRVYEEQETDRMFAETAPLLVYIGSVIIKRSLWLSRDRDAYVGSMWIHLGVIFQHTLPGRTLVIAKPCVSYRDGNSKSYMTRFFEIVCIKFPELIWGAPFSERAKRQVIAKEPWRELRTLVLNRACGCYSLREYREFVRPRLRSTWQALMPVAVATLPGSVLNILCVIHYHFFSANRLRGTLMQALKDSRYYPMRNLSVFGI